MSEDPIEFDPQGALVFLVSHEAGRAWHVFEQGLHKPLASFDLRAEACDYAHELASLNEGSLVISDPPEYLSQLSDDPPRLSLAGGARR